MLNEEATQRFFQQAFELWINPELKRRQENGKLPAGFDLDTAEIVMFGDGRPLAVRLNEEVRSTFFLRVPSEKAKDFKIGDNITIDEYQVMEIKPPADEINDAHVVLIRSGTTWAYTFDFTYNNGHIAECYKVAKEFYETARDSFSHDRVRACVYNLHGAVELMSKCLLLTTPGIAGKHGFIQTQMNLRKKRNVIGGDFAPLLNRLWGERRKARHETVPYNMDRTELESALNQAAEFLKVCDSQISRRARDLLKAAS